MSSKSSIKMMNGLLTLFFFTFSLIFTSNTNAQVYGGMYGGIGMQGSGYYGGTQGCGFPQMMGTNAVSKSDDERDAEDAIKRIQSEAKLAKLEQQRAEKELELLRRKVERSFESSVAEFLLDVHIEGSKMCNEYEQTFVTPPPPPPAPAAANGHGTVSVQEVDANGKPVQGAPARQVAASQQPATTNNPLEVPDLLKGKWSRYCTANTKASAGSVSPAICKDASLRESGKRGTSGSESDCAKSLANYRKKRMDLGKASDKVEDLEASLEDAKFNLQDAKARAKLDRELNKGNTEAGCPDGTCGQAGRGYVFQSNKTNIISGAIQMGGGILASYMGARYDDRNTEYCAQLGYPPGAMTPDGIPCSNFSARMAGLPLMLTGVNTMINGGVGQGSFGCGTGASGGYFPYGMGGNSGGMGMYGPYGNMGGAFGYPAGMYGAPWGGGMYNPGMTPGGGFYGPNGGYPGGMNGMYGINGGINGMGGYGTFPGIGIGGGIGAGMGGMGMPGMYPGMPGYGMGGMGMPGMGGYGGFPGIGIGGGIGAGMGGMGMPGMYPGMPGYGMGGMGVPGMGGYGGFPGMGGMGGMVGMYPGGMMGNPQYQMQMLQMQQQMAQQQMQYYQAQMQQQMQAYQRQMAIQQQAYQVQQEIASLQMRLQMIYSGAYSGGVSGGAIIGSPYPLTGGGVGGYPGGYPAGYPTGYPTGTGAPGTPAGNATFPGVGNGVPSGGR